MYYTQYSCSREDFQILPCPSPPNYSTSTSIFRHHSATKITSQKAVLAFFEKRWIIGIFLITSTPWCMIIKKVAKCQKKSVPNLCRSPPNYIYWLLPPTFSEQRRPWSLSTRMRARASPAARNANNIYYHHPLLVMLNWYIVLSLLEQKLMMNKITFFTKNSNWKGSHSTIIFFSAFFWVLTSCEQKMSSSLFFQRDPGLPWYWNKLVHTYNQLPMLLDGAS